MKVAKFKYRLDNTIINLLQGIILGFNSDYLVGYLEEAVSTRINACSLYLVCDFDENPNTGVQTYSNPICIVALNDSHAAKVYGELTGRPALILQVLSYNCSDLTVETLD